MGWAIIIFGLSIILASFLVTDKRDRKLLSHHAVVIDTDEVPTYLGHPMFVKTEREGPVAYFGMDCFAFRIVGTKKDYVVICNYDKEDKEEMEEGEQEEDGRLLSPSSTVAQNQEVY